MLGEGATSPPVRKKNMAKIYYGTDFVLEDEPCFNLAEVNLMAPKDGKWHRYQIVVVIRNGELAEYRKDMGLRTKFKAHQFRVMGGVIDKKKIYIEETVGSLRQEADQMRDETPLNIRELTNC